MDATEAAAMLMDSPVEFLQANCLSISGGRTLSSGLRIWTLSEHSSLREMVIVGPDFSIVKKVRNWRAQVTSDTSNRSLHVVQEGDTLAAEFRAFYVPMRQVGDAVATSHYTLPHAAGPGLMLTSQLTGCTFGYGSQTGGGCLVSHIQPNAQALAGSAALRTAVTGPMGAGATVLETTQATLITVVGKRDDATGIWHFHKQVLDANTRRLTIREANF